MAPLPWKVAVAGAVAGAVDGAVAGPVEGAVAGAVAGAVEGADVYQAYCVCLKLLMAPLDDQL